MPGAAPGTASFAPTPAKKDSRWKLHGPFGSGGGQTVAAARAEREPGEDGGS